VNYVALAASANLTFLFLEHLEYIKDVPLFRYLVLSGGLYAVIQAEIVVGNFVAAYAYGTPAASESALLAIALLASLLAYIIIGQYVERPALYNWAGKWTLVYLSMAAICFGALLALPAPQNSSGQDAIERIVSGTVEPVSERSALAGHPTQLPPAFDNSIPVPTIPTSSESTTLRLKLRRSQRSTILGKVLFGLDARMELSSEELQLVRKYQLGKDVVYDSANREKYSENLQARLEMSRGGPSLMDSPGAQLLGTGKTLFHLARGAASAVAASLSLRVTINSLISGIHVECKSLGELLEAETAIVEAATNLKSYLQSARTFDGREEILEF
jgi:hypothetical protein